MFREFLAQTLLVWGQNNYGQLGLGPDTLWTSRPVSLNIPDVIFTNVAAGSYHTVAVDHLNRAWTFGWGIHGQLGNGKVENVYFPQPLDIKVHTHRDLTEFNLPLAM